MFMLDLQGDPQGLSIGGLVVITKSLSLTVGLFRERQLDLREELQFWLKSANFAIYYYFNFLTDRRSDYFLLRCYVVSAELTAIVELRQ